MSHDKVEMRLFFAHKTPLSHATVIVLYVGLTGIIKRFLSISGRSNVMSSELSISRGQFVPENFLETLHSSPVRVFRRKFNAWLQLLCRYRDLGNIVLHWTAYIN